MALAGVYFVYSATVEERNLTKQFPDIAANGARPNARALHLLADDPSLSSARLSCSSHHNPVAGIVMRQLGHDGRVLSQCSAGRDAFVRS